MSKKIVTLCVISWCGFGGEHYCGTLSGEDGGEYKSSEIYYYITQKDATAFNKKDQTRFGSMRYKKGDKSDRFWKIGDLERKAIEQYKAAFPDALVLNTGSYAVCNPQRVLDGPEWFKDATNKLYDEQEACGGYEGDEKKTDRIFRDYQKLVKKL